MKKTINFIKSNSKLLTGLVLGLALSSGVTYAATAILDSNQVGFDNTNTTLSATDVQGALDELYEKASSYDEAIGYIPTMQTFNKSNLSTVGSYQVLRDARDNSLYTVRKLSDGNVWMMQNLKISNKEITSADSDVSSNFTIPASSTEGFDAQNLNNAYVDSYGGYYSFYTATAGTGGTTLTSGNATSSICPKGWKLPTGGSSGDYQRLAYYYNTVALLQGDPSFVMAGFMYRGTISDRGRTGRYWTSTAKDANSAYGLWYDRSEIDATGDVNMKYPGYTIRCIAR